MIISPLDTFSIVASFLGIVLALYGLRLAKGNKWIIIFSISLFILVFGYLSYSLFWQPNSLPTIKDLMADRANPQKAGAIITWTASAIDPDNDQLLYMFLLNGKPITTWIDSNSYIWITDEADVGSNQFEVRVKDGKHTSPEDYDCKYIKFFSIIGNEPPIVKILTSDIPSPQEAGTTVTWAALASDPENDPLQYRFSLDGHLKTNWFSNPTWIFTTSAADIGSHVIEVEVKDNKHNVDGDSYKFDNFVITAPNPMPIEPASVIPEAIVNQQNASAWNEKGIALAGQGKYDEAIEAYDESIKLNPNDAVVWTNKGVALYKQGNYERAIQAYDKAIVLKPDYAEAWGEKSTALNSQCRVSEAVKASDKANELNPNLEVWWINNSRCYS